MCAFGYRLIWEPVPCSRVHLPSIGSWCLSCASFVKGHGFVQVTDLGLGIVGHFLAVGVFLFFTSMHTFLKCGHATLRIDEHVIMIQAFTVGPVHMWCGPEAGMRLFQGVVSTVFLVFVSTVENIIVHDTMMLKMSTSIRAQIRFG
jgi:hypothetical protein